MFVTSLLYLHDTVTETLTVLSFQLINNSSDCIPRNTSHLIFNYVENVINIAELCVMLLVTVSCQEWGQLTPVTWWWSVSADVLDQTELSTPPGALQWSHCLTSSSLTLVQSLLHHNTVRGSVQHPTITHFWVDTLKAGASFPVRQNQSNFWCWITISEGQGESWVGGTAFIESFYHTICYPYI